MEIDETILLMESQRIERCVLMKKTKISLIIVAILFIIVGTIGAAVSFKRQEIDTRNTKALVQKSDPQTNEKLTIVVQSPNPLKIVPTNENFFTLTQKNNKKDNNFKWEIANKKDTTEVHLTSKKSGGSSNFHVGVSVELFSLPLSSNEDFQLRVPKQYKQILVKTTNGDILINDMETEELRCIGTKGTFDLTNLIAKQVEAKVTSGNVMLSDSNIDEQAEAATTSGQIYVDSVKTKRFTSQTTSGHLFIDDIDCQTMNLSATSGTIDIRTVNKETEINALATSGNILFTLPEGLSKNNVATKTVSGEVTIDEEIKSMKHHMMSKDKKVLLSTTSGDIHLSTDD